VARQDNNPGTFRTGVPDENTRTLSDIGITRKESSTSQRDRRKISDTKVGTEKKHIRPDQAGENKI